MYDMFNIVPGETGKAQAVLVRAAEPLDEWQADLSGLIHCYVFMMQIVQQ